MCYPYPGPRCSSHARKALTKSYSDYENESERSPLKGDLYTAYREKRAEYFATPAGQQWLEQQIGETGDPNGSLEREKEMGARARAQALERMSEFNLSPQAHTAEEAEPDDADINKLRYVEQSRRKERISAEELMVQLRDKFEYAEATEEGNVREVLNHRENLRRATNSFTQAYETWTLAFEEVESAEKREEGIEE